MTRKLLTGKIVLMAVIALLIMACLAFAAPVVVDTVTVNTSPCGIVVNPATNRVFVTHQGQATNNFTVIRTTDDVVENVFTVGDDPSGIDVNTLTNKVYVANWNSNDIAVRSGSDGSQVHPNIPSFGNPYRVAVSEHLNRVYVTNNSANQVTVLNGASDTIMATIPLTDSPLGICVNDATDRAYVTFWGGQVGVIDCVGNTISTYVALPGGPDGEAVAVDSTLNKIFVACSNNTIYTIDGETNAVTGSFSCNGYYGMDVNPATHRLYVSNAGTANLSVFNSQTNAWIGDVVTGTQPMLVAFDGATYRGYVANLGGNSVTVFTDLPMYNISLIAEDGGGSVAGGGTFPLNSSVTVHGIPISDCHLISWWDPDVGTVSFSADYTFTVTRDRSLYATFGYYIDAEADPSAGGSAFSPGDSEYGDLAIVSASPHGGYHFLNWTKGGVEVSTDQNYSFYPTADCTLVAHFITTPTVTTTAVTSITSITASSGGNVTAGGGASVTHKGVCWSTSPNPTTSDSKTDNGTGAGGFTSNITGLNPGTLYHVRAYATNSVGTSYGSDLNFTTPTLPTLSTNAVTNITSTTASSGGSSITDGGASITHKGVCWSTSPNPTITDPATDDGTGTGDFTSNMTGLTPGTPYHVRAYATNSVGTSYGSDLNFTTPTTPALATITPSNITSTTASSGGNVTFDGGDPVTARGVCWSTSPSPTTSDGHTTDGSGTGVFASNITGLTPGTPYHVRAYATNGVGTSYGDEQPFTTPTTPALTTTAASSITSTTADSGGNVTSDGGDPVTARGVCFSTSPSPTTLDVHTTDGSGTGIFSSNITGLTPGTLYHVRAYATNGVGTSYGSDLNFTTPTLPTVTTTAASSITSTTASSGGNVTSDGGASVTHKGVCWSASPNPTITDPATDDGTGTGIFASSITGLTPGTLYHVRAYATNSVGTSYGNEQSFTTPTYTWYLPEGSTDGGMETWIMLENPNPDPVTADLVFDTGDGEVAPPALSGLTIPASSRISCDVTSFITTYDLATRVISHGGRLNCERATYGNNRAWGTDSIGATDIADTWYMAEGCTDGGMETYILVQNPNAETVHVSLDFLTSSGQVPGPEDFRIPAGTRLTFAASDYVTAYDVACEVTSTGGGVVCERSTYGGDQEDGWAWATSSTGTPFASALWYVPGMHTGNGAWTLIANPNTTAANVDIKYYSGSNVIQGPRGSVPARSRVTFNAGDYVPDAYVSAMVTSSGTEVVCEWAEYAPDFSWGNSSLAAPGLSSDLFFTEGSTDGGMQTIVTVFNPGDTNVTASFILYTGEGQMTVPALTDVTIPARGTFTANLNDYVTSYDVSTRVVAKGLVTGKRMTSCPGSGWCTASGAFTMPI